MNVKLIFPLPSQEYEGMTWATEKLVEPPNSSLAVLTATAKQYFPDMEISCMGDSVTSGTTGQDYAFGCRSVDEMIEFCADADVVGASVWFHNLRTSFEIAKRLKEIDPDKKFILGGHGAADPITAKLVLEQHPSIDFIVRGDGEEAFTGLLEGKNPNDIPNLSYLIDGVVQRTKSKNFDLNRRQLWDFRDFVGHEDIMRGYDSQSLLFEELRADSGGSFIGRVGVPYTTGCEKAASKEEGGPCAYCTSYRTIVQSMHAKKFWEQVQHLYNTHGITEFFLTDDIAATLPKLHNLSQVRKTVLLTESIQFRAYGYAPFFTKEDTPEMIRLMNEVGIVNLFLGIENFSQDVNLEAHKRAFDYDEIKRVIRDITSQGIDVFLPMIIGMPGETEEILRYNAGCLNEILSLYAGREYGRGRIVRLDLSGGMPLRGTRWYRDLANNPEVLDFYRRQTGIELGQHIDPDYRVLSKASVTYLHPTGIAPDRLDQHKEGLLTIALQYLKPEQIGGFDFKQKKK